MAAEGSDIGRVVQAFGHCLDLVSDAEVHAEGARLQATDSFALYRQALAGSDAVDPVAGTVLAGSASIDAGQAALDRARTEIRRFVLTIAPGLALVDSPEVRETPEGENLLETSTRPRSLRQFTDALGRHAEDAAGLVNEFRDIGQSTLELFTPPDPAGFSSAAQTPSVAVDRPGPAVGGGGDPVLTGAVVVAVVAKGTQITVRRLKRFLRGGNES